jgi:hypothetical protein
VLHARVARIQHQRVLHGVQAAQEITLALGRNHPVAQRLVLVK